MDQVKHRIIGDDIQAVEITLDPGEAMRSEVGAMLYMEDGIHMQTKAEGGIFKGLKRMVTGESFFITSFENQSRGTANISFAAPYPGKIIPIDLTQFGGEFICQRDSFLCAPNGIDIGIAFTKRLGSGFFGGEGFILQRLQGDGIAYIHSGGTIIRKDLQAGETLRLDTGCLVGMSPGVDYDIKFVGGIKNALFGGEGLFLAHLKGPGTVFIQSLPFQRIADRIMSTAMRGKSKEQGGLFSMSDFLDGD